MSSDISAVLARHQAYGRHAHGTHEISVQIAALSVMWDANGIRRHRIRPARRLPLPTLRMGTRPARRQERYMARQTGHAALREGARTAEHP